MYRYSQQTVKMVTLVIIVFQTICKSVVSRLNVDLLIYWVLLFISIHIFEYLYSWLSRLCCIVPVSSDNQDLTVVLSIIKLPILIKKNVVSMVNLKDFTKSWTLWTDQSFPTNEAKYILKGQCAYKHDRLPVN